VLTRAEHLAIDDGNLICPEAEAVVPEVIRGKC
jgi:hypothetical protein